MDLVSTLKTIQVMAEEKIIQIIGNESNNVFEVEAGDNAHSSEGNTTAEKVAEAEHLSTAAAQRSNDEVATNDGAIIETLDTAFHHKPGVAEGENISGSDRADYYEAHSQGKSDSEEELDALNKDE